MMDGVPVHMIHRQQEDTSHHHNFFSMLLADSYFVWCVCVLIM